MSISHASPSLLPRAVSPLVVTSCARSAWRSSKTEALSAFSSSVPSTKLLTSPLLSCRIFFCCSLPAACCASTPPIRREPCGSPRALRASHVALTANANLEKRCANAFLQSLERAGHRADVASHGAAGCGEFGGLLLAQRGALRHRLLGLGPVGLVLHEDLVELALCSRCRAHSRRSTARSGRRPGQWRPAASPRLMNNSISPRSPSSARRCRGYDRCRPPCKRWSRGISLAMKVALYVHTSAGAPGRAATACPSRRR